MQVHKLDQYCTWSGLSVNASKCCVTGILYGDCATRSVKHAHSPENTQILRTQLEGQMRLGGAIIPFIPPDQPYKYLGVLVTLTLDWSRQLA